MLQRPMMRAYITWHTGAAAIISVSARGTRAAAAVDGRRKRDKRGDGNAECDRAFGRGSGRDAEYEKSGGNAECRRKSDGETAAAGDG